MTGPSRGLTHFGQIGAAALLASGCLLTNPLPDTGAGGSSGQMNSSGSGGSASTGRCTSHKQCTDDHAGDPYICRASDGQCVPLVSTACPLPSNLQYATDPNAIFVGAFTDLNKSELENSSAVYAYRLALDEFNNLGGLEGGPNGARRPLVAVMCYDDPEYIESAMQFLTEELQIRAIVAGFRQPKDLVTSFEKYATGKVFFLSPYGGSSDLRQLNDNGLVWSLLGSPGDFAEIYAALLERLERFVRKDRSFEASRELKVVTFQTQDSFSSELANAVSPGLRFNQRSLDANLDAGTYLPLSFDAATEGQPDLDAKVKSILDFRPDVVLSFAGPAFSGGRQRGVVGQLQTQWGSDTPRPFYVLSPLNDGSLESDDVAGFIESEALIHPEAQPYRRFLGIGSGLSSDPTLRNEFNVRLATHYARAPRGTEQFYDAMYLLGYAIYGAGSVSNVQGPDIARGMKRLLNGPSFDIGPKRMGQVISVLKVPEGELSLKGTLGPPNFDVASGMRIDPGSVFCYDENAVLERYALTYDLDTHQLSGTFPCFDDF
ncbi:MAG TPA: hypothetical protein VFQ61_23920 [Polyangiaceae bacterium]|nr:hypothetical protein [Polyangiaceae bacterium]